MASVFIIESVTFEDEDARRMEGSILSDILRLADKSSEYRYIRTRAEFEAVLKQFKRTRYRYLHISCHANSSEIATTLDSIPFDEFAEIVAPYLGGRRLFISACRATNATLARAVMERCDCLSIVGPTGDVSFGDAAIMWASFYHLMFKISDSGMNTRKMNRVLADIAETYKIPLKHFVRSTTKPPFTQRTFRGRP